MRKARVSKDKRVPKEAPVRRPKQSRSRETERALLDATDLILRNEGIAAVTTTRVAKLAGVAVGSVYDYFPSREALIYAVEHRKWAEVGQAVVARAVASRGQPMADIVEDLVRHAIDQTIVKSGHHGLTAPTEIPQEGRVEMLDQLGTFIVESLSHSRTKLAPEDLQFAVRFVLRVVGILTWLGSRDFPAELANGKFQEAVATMVRGYLVLPTPSEGVAAPVDGAASPVDERASSEPAVTEQESMGPLALAVRSGG